MASSSLDNPYGLPELDRGVYRDKGAPVGYLRWRVYNAEGVLIREEMAKADVFVSDEEILDAERALRKWLEDHDRRLLRAV